MTETPQMDISSTFIRKSIKGKKNIQYFVPDTVIAFMEGKNMYR
jgi:nicotinate-nucleotide adenylyltransferase